METCHHVIMPPHRCNRAIYLPFICFYWWTAARQRPTSGSPPHIATCHFFTYRLVCRHWTEMWMLDRCWTAVGMPPSSRRKNARKNYVGPTAECRWWPARVMKCGPTATRRSCAIWEGEDHIWYFQSTGEATCSDILRAVRGRQGGWNRRRLQRRYSRADRRHSAILRGRSAVGKLDEIAAARVASNRGRPAVVVLSGCLTCWRV